MQPPATEVLYDQFDLLMTELAKRRAALRRCRRAVRSQDAEAPVPTEYLDLRITDRNVVLARIELPQSQSCVLNTQMPCSGVIERYLTRCALLVRFS